LKPSEEEEGWTRTSKKKERKGKQARYDGEGRTRKEERDEIRQLIEMK